MTPAADLRVGSLEILAALVVFGVVVGRLRPGAAASSKRPKAVELQLRVHEAAARGAESRDVTVGLGEQSPARIIGRSSEADVGLLDPEVSRRHARLDFARGIVYLSDLGSSNGTFLNGKPVRDEGIEVRPGDDIDVGNTRISVIGTAPASWT
jgi:pSer/pThr/pTyr-binding forkhead associated (FHA) protein